MKTQKPLLPDLSLLNAISREKLRKDPSIHFCLSTIRKLIDLSEKKTGVRENQMCACNDLLM